MLPNLRMLRKQRGMTIEELARKFDLSKSSVSQYETGKREPSNETLAKLAAYFEVSVGYLIGVEEENQSDYSVDIVYSTFRELRPEYQEYVLKQIDLLLEIQKKEKRT